jgi:tRNA 2-thiouridine synthesizing protein E
MRQKDGNWLTTGQAAELCAVTSATVLNWIRKGRLEGVRTAGGHYRIKREVLEPLLDEHHSTGWEVTPQAKHAMRPLRCWEYMSDGGVVRDECKDCMVHSMRAAWCFQVATLDPELHKAGLLCPTSCDDCAYFRRVMGLPTNVLVTTSDQELVDSLDGERHNDLTLRVAHNEYEAAALVQDFLPDFAVVDQEYFPASEGGLLDNLAGDSRLPGLKIIAAVPHGATRLGIGANRTAVVRVIEKPFGLSQIAAVIESFPVESIPPEEVWHSDLSPTGGTAMMTVQQAKPTADTRLSDDGFLKTMANWDRAAAEALAKEHGIGELSEEHWRVIEFVQQYYKTYNKGPPVVQVHKETGLHSTDICRLFPCGMVKGAYRLAGLPRPPGCG